MVFAKVGFLGNILLDFHARTVPPCTDDIIFVWNVEGWDYAKNDAGIGYIGGLGGWWAGKIGLERYPECALRASTSLFKLQAGRIYRIQAGNITGYCFIAVDGCVALEVQDPSPLDTNRFNRVGLGVYCSHVQFRDVSIKQIKWNPVLQSYTPNF